MSSVRFLSFLRCSALTQNSSMSTTSTRWMETSWLHLSTAVSMSSMTSPLTLGSRLSPSVTMPEVGVGVDIPTGTGWSVECGKCIVCED